MYMTGRMPSLQQTLLGEIEFDHVNFYYEDRKPVLTDFSLKVQPGEMIALVGPTGGGKSTIVNLLCRFYEPCDGMIRINGRDYMDYTLASIHSRIGIVLQTPHLFSGSIRDNIRYGRLDASDEEVIEAAKIAGAHDFIVTLEKSYDQNVGEGGNLLSVGQKQLISLARAVLARPELFIMDEATSSVDTLTEALIQRGMEALMKGRTSFVIAHRLSTIRRANRILVIENGRIAEQGTHAELLRLGGHYYRLYTQQFRHELENQYGLSEAVGVHVNEEATGIAGSRLITTLRRFSFSINYVLAITFARFSMREKMKTEILPFTSEMIPDAAKLLSQRHKRNRTNFPLLPARFEESQAARRAIEALWKEKLKGGYAAFCNGEMTAYLIGETTTDPWGRAGYVYLPGYAMADGESPRIIQDLYAVLGDDWVRKGCFNHYLYLSALDADVIAALFDLGFGKERVDALLDLRSLTIPEIEAAIRCTDPQGRTGRQ